MIPIDRKSKDLFFRYKMPSLEITKECNKTVLLNLGVIAKSLCRDPFHIIKYLGMTLGCTQISDRNKFMLNGLFESQRLQTLIFDYIDLFVLCETCRNPETKYVMEDSVLKKKCNSCGSVNNQAQHKLNKTIIKDYETGVNEDNKYEKSNKQNIIGLIKEDKENSADIYEVFCRMNLDLSDLFTEYFRASNLCKLMKIIGNHKLEEVLPLIEVMLEKAEKEDKIKGFLKVLCENNFPFEEIEKYYTGGRPCKNKLIKKNAIIFIKNYEY